MEEGKRRLLRFAREIEDGIEDAQDSDVQAEQSTVKKVRH